MLLIIKGLRGGQGHPPTPMGLLPLLWNDFDAVRLVFGGGYYLSISNFKTLL